MKSFKGKCGELTFADAVFSVFRVNKLSRMVKNVIPKIFKNFHEYEKSYPNFQEWTRSWTRFFRPKYRHFPRDFTLANANKKIFSGYKFGKNLQNT